MNMALRRADVDLTSWPVGRPDASAASIAASHYDPGIERQRKLLMSTIGLLARHSATWSEREPVPIGRVSAETAFAFIRELPTDRAFPDVAPDGDGGIVMIWNRPDNRLLITVDEATLLCVRDPGGLGSYHFAPLRFDGETIPPMIMEQLPRR
jgi:hypothetical protein